jgi:hypothetical protein
MEKMEKQLCTGHAGSTAELANSREAQVTQLAITGSSQQ